MDFAEIRTSFFMGVASRLGDIGWYNPDFSDQNCYAFVDTFTGKSIAVLISKTSEADLLIPFLKDNNTYKIDFEVFVFFSMSVTASTLYEMGLKAKSIGSKDAAHTFFELVIYLKESYNRLMRLWVRHSLVQMMITPARRAELEDQEQYFALAETEINRLDNPQMEFINTGSFRALLVGVSLYEDAYNSQLPFCVNDVSSLRDVLTQTYDIIRTLTEKSTEGLPNRASILTELDNMARSSDEDDLLLFYFSGHGTTSNGEGYLLARDTKSSSLRYTGIAIREIGEILRNCEAKAKILVIDSCHAGETIGKTSNTMTQVFLERVFFEAEGTAVLASCKHEQKSYVWEEQQTSVYTYYFLQALSGQADTDKKGFVTVNDVNRFVTDGVKTWALQHGVSQTPTLQYTVVGDIILYRYQL
jgi:hypothetical protein